MVVCVCVCPVLFNVDQQKLPECSVCNILQNVELTLFLQYDCYPWCETPLEICHSICLNAFLSYQDKTKILMTLLLLVNVIDFI